MMKKASFFLLACAAFYMTPAKAQPGKENIEKLCGCFSVNFQYAETFAMSDDYEYRDRKDMNAIEWVMPVVAEEGKMALQHLLVINDSLIIKHWREEWIYEYPEILEFQGDKVWTSKTLPEATVKGAWTQTVWEVNDEPRYQGYGHWIHNDGKTYWESTVDAPLPRREYTQRSDYNILRRQNRLIISESGYVHEQDNKKIIRENGVDRLLVLEKGYNTYYRVDEAECAPARKYWEENQLFWTLVRENWEQAIEGAEKLRVEEKVEDKILGEHFTALFKEWKTTGMKEAELNRRIKEVILSFLHTS